LKKISEIYLKLLDIALNEYNSIPKHLHNGTEENVIESYISDNPKKAVREFLDFIRGKMLG
jgi:hypothetical protein